MARPRSSFCMDLEEIAESDRTSVGLRLAAKLRTILRPLNLDLQTISGLVGVRAGASES